jgi:predicted DNA-binding protein (MmcQ/YjbR family)
MNDPAQFHARLSEICLALPGAEEAAWGTHRQFSAGGKVFARFMLDHHGDGRIALWCKALPEVQQALLASQEDRYFLPPYVGRQGWLGVHLDRVSDWDEVTDLVRESYRLLIRAGRAASE